MELSRKFNRFFLPGVRKEGDECYEGGRVQVEHTSQVAASAQVYGAELYHADLKIAGETKLRVCCSCPDYKQTFEPCAHLWGLLRVCDRELALRAALSNAVQGLDFGDIQAGARLRRSQSAAVVDSSCRLLYLIDVALSEKREILTLRLAMGRPTQDGQWSVFTGSGLGRAQLDQVRGKADCRILTELLGSPDKYRQNPFAETSSFVVQGGSAVLEWMCGTGRCCLNAGGQTTHKPLKYSPDPWEFELTIKSEGDACLLEGVLHRSGQSQPISNLDLPAPGTLIQAGAVSPLRDHGAFSWIAALRKCNPLRIPAANREQLLNKIIGSPSLPLVTLGPEFGFREVRGGFRPELYLQTPRSLASQKGKLYGKVRFYYDGGGIPAGKPGVCLVKRSPKRIIYRDLESETLIGVPLEDAGMRLIKGDPMNPAFEVTCESAPDGVRRLLSAGWTVELDGKPFRKADALKVHTRTDSDWIEVEGEAEFGSEVTSLSNVLTCLRQGQPWITLSDGSLGVLDDEALRSCSLLLGLGNPVHGKLRMARSQALLLDVLLSRMDVACDAAFAAVRRNMRSFAGVQPVDAPVGFQGKLREYQREGLGWLCFLQRYSLGGCLADDMGLGKTIQVLAFLERIYRAADAPALPSLVVVPRSLVFNWEEEAARFTPGLKVLSHVGPQRDMQAFEGAELILTTYGVLRRDVEGLAAGRFFCCILDEAQAIKNQGTDAAKAARVIRAEHRLALTGTPIENRLEELWSLLEFLNPGMLGSVTRFRAMADGISQEERTMLARAIRSIILRRTKREVAKELPEKTEQTIYCELGPPQQALYDELKSLYRRTLLKDGVADSSRFQVLEALLRLRQAACHPGLLDDTRREDESAKLDALLAMLVELVSEGHKALVFSQFTSMLALVRPQLDALGISYEYLDGQTRNRQKCVDRFQRDPSKSVFLISLKAGGTGLNLTAAGYVFLLDPWWNPAVEAQAIDRAHRIGQTQEVFAYRLIARGTVEERILQMQSSKRALADAILGGDNNLVRDLSREDLDYLLS